jgi:NADP-dependent 3-hydroxy acid dehydrogenase YdfG
MDCAGYTVARGQEGRLAIVTGATSGIGFHTAEELAMKGATVIMPARDLKQRLVRLRQIEGFRVRLPLAQISVLTYSYE